MGRKRLSDSEIEHRNELKRRLVERIESSVASPTSAKRAEYVANKLLFHELDLLAELAATYASAQLAALGWMTAEAQKEGNG